MKIILENEGNIPNFGEIAVILIDMQSVFVEQIPKHKRIQMVGSQKIILELCELLDIPVCFIEVADNEFVTFGETISELQFSAIPRKKVIKKTFRDGFENKELKETLQAWGKKRLLFAGIFANLCVLSTAKSAISAGFEIMTSPSLIAGSSEEGLKGCIPWFKENGTVCPLLIA